MTQVDLPSPAVIWTIAEAAQKRVGTDEKVCLSFQEFGGKPLGLNKCNLKNVASLYGVEADAWIGKTIKLYRAMTQFSGKSMLCIRCCGADQQPPEQVYDAAGNPVVPPAPAQVAAAPVQPVAAAVQAAPVAASANPQPWEGAKNNAQA